jgi:ABC-2 type transport system permease protein
MKTNPVRVALSTAWKDLQVIFKDRGLLVIIIGLPLVISVMNGYMNEQFSSSSEGMTFPVILVDQDNDTYGKQIETILNSIDVLDISTLDSPEEAENQVRDSKVLAAIIIPPGLTQAVQDYQHTEVDVVIDPTQRDFASIITAIMNEVVGPITVQGEVSYAIRTLLSEIPAYQQLDANTQYALEMQNFGVQMAQVQQMENDPWVSIETRTMDDEDVVLIPDNMFALLVPGFVVMFVFFIVGAMGSELLQERQQGSLRRLMAAPIPRWSIIIAKMLAYIGLVLVQVMIIFGIASFFFGMPLGESLFGLLLVSFFLGLTSTSLGVMVAALSRTDKQADSIGIMLGFVLAALGGCFMIGSPVPLFNQGGTLQIISRLTPHAHALIAYGKLLNQGAGAIDILPQVGILLAFSAAFFLIAVWRFRFEQK